MTEGFFLRPDAWPLLLAPPGVALLLLFLDRLRARRLRRVAGLRSAALSADLSPARRRNRRLLFGIAGLLACAAILSPAWGRTVEDADPGSVDLVICLDVSRSMLARDLAPDRLSWAKAAIRDLADHAAGDRFALVVFAGEARLLVPATRDLASFGEILGLADPYSVERGGTDPGAALRLAASALAGRSGEHKAILLLSDGDPTGDAGAGARAAAAALAERGIVVHCVGLGSARGAKIPVPTATGERFLTDGAGREVVSALDPAGLRRIAEATGGEYVAAGEAENPLRDLYERRIRPMARTLAEADASTRRENRFQWPLLVAFLLFLVEFARSDARGVRAGVRRARPAFYALRRRMRRGRVLPPAVPTPASPPELVH